MSYTPSTRDIVLIRQAATLLGAEADDLRKCSTLAPLGEWPEDEADAQENYETMKTVQVRLDDLARRMKT